MFKIISAKANVDEKSPFQKPSVIDQWVSDYLKENPELIELKLYQIYDKNDELTASLFKESLCNNKKLKNLQTLDLSMFSECLLTDEVIKAISDNLRQLKVIKIQL